jgi:pimeloyl-ACP methyl ester carboxylesterase
MQTRRQYTGECNYWLAGQGIGFPGRTQTGKISISMLSRNILDQFFVFHPERWHDRDWRSASGLPLEDVWFQAADGTKLFGWYVEAQADSPILVWCHGNAGNIVHRLDNLRLLFRQDFSVFLFDYRGYGRSQNRRPSEEGLYLDAIGAHDYLTRVRMIRPERLVIFGRSLGAAVAADLALHKPAAGLILESAFPSVEAVAKFYYGGLPVHWLLGAEFRVIDRVPALSLPKLMIHGEQDDIIPLELGRQVFEAAKPPKSFHLITGAHHNKTQEIGGAAYLRLLADFADRAIRS